MQNSVCLKKTDRYPHRTNELREIMLAGGWGRGFRDLFLVNLLRELLNPGGGGPDPSDPL